MKRFSRLKLNKMLKEKSMAPQDLRGLWLDTVHTFISQAAIDLWVDMNATSTPRGGNFEKLCKTLQCKPEDLQDDVPVDDISDIEHELMLYCKVHPDYVNKLITKLEKQL